MSDASSVGMLAVTQGMSAFNAFLPSLTDVRQAAANDTTMVASVRTGEFAGTAVTISIGAIASSLSKSSLPSVLALIIVGIMITIYESALHKGL